MMLYGVQQCAHVSTLEMLSAHALYTIECSSVYMSTHLYLVVDMLVDTAKHVANADARGWSSA